MDLNGWRAWQESSCGPGDPDVSAELGLYDSALDNWVRAEHEWVRGGPAAVP